MAAAPPAPRAGGKRARIAAASELQQVPRLKYILFILLAVFIQWNWGLFGVCSRYLQTRSSAPMPSMQLMVLEQAVALAGLFVFVVLPSLARAGVRAARGALAGSGGALPLCAPVDAEVQLTAAPSKTGSAPSDERAQAAAPASPVAPRSDASRYWTTIDSGVPAGVKAIAQAPAAAPGADGEQQSTTEAAPLGADERRVARRAALQSFGAAAGIGLLVAMQALTLVWASRLIYAFLVQLVMLMTPLVTALANRLLLRQRTPRGLWPALAAALGGSALVIAGNYMSEAARTGAGGAAATNAKSMAAGLALAVTSMLLLSSYLVALQVTQRVTTGRHVMFGNLLMGLVVVTPLAFAVEGADWSWVHRLTLFDWAVLAFAGFFIDALNTLWTQKASRVLGAAIMSLFICMRLVSSVAGSAALLNEAPTSPLVWAGMGVCVAAMTAFLGLQAWDKTRAQRAAAAAAGDEEGVEEGDGDVEEGRARAQDDAAPTAAGAPASPAVAGPAVARGPA